MINQHGQNQWFGVFWFFWPTLRLGEGTHSKNNSDPSAQGAQPTILYWGTLNWIIVVCVAGDVSYARHFRTSPIQNLAPTVIFIDKIRTRIAAVTNVVVSLRRRKWPIFKCMVPISIPSTSIQNQARGGEECNCFRVGARVVSWFFWHSQLKFPLRWALLSKSPRRFSLY